MYGDWHKIRNDLLHHNGVASGPNSARCEILKWFEAGETIRFKLDHVLEFLHLIGNQLRSYMLMDRARPLHYVGWRMAPAIRLVQSRLPEARQPPWRVVSANFMVEEDKETKGSYTLGVSLMFADAVVGAFAWETSADRDSLVSLKRESSKRRATTWGVRQVYAYPCSCCTSGPKKRLRTVSFRWIRARHRCSSTRGLARIFDFGNLAQFHSVRNPVKVISRSTLKVIIDSTVSDHLSERSDAGA